MSHSTADFEALKAKLKANWTTGDFGRIAKLNEAGAEAFMARRAIAPGSRVLDVACGTGNLSIPAARAGALVTGVDIANNLLEQARARAKSEGLDIRFDEGDAESLPYPDISFDRVVSMFGAMFAPRPERTAAELVRVCRPGGEIAMANWVPDSFVGEMFRLVASYVAAPPGVPAPSAWGEPDRVRERLSEGIADLKMTRCPFAFNLPFSVPETVEYYRLYFGPAQRAFASLPEDKQADLRRDLERLWSQYNTATDGTVSVKSEYLEVVAKRAS